MRQIMMTRELKEGVEMERDVGLLIGRDYYFLRVRQILEFKKRREFCPTIIVKRIFPLENMIRFVENTVSLFLEFVIVSETIRKENSGN